MDRLYKVLNKQDCVEMGLYYTPTQRIIVAEHNSGHYTITRYTSPLGKVCIVILSPIILLYHILRGVWVGIKDCVCAYHDTFEMCDRREVWGEENKYISYLKNRY